MNKINIKLMLTSVAALISISGVANAQVVAQANVEAERTLNKQLLDSKRLNEAVRASASAPLAREVTYGEVMADPGNVELNILYARTQIQKGRLDKAQATLERVLLEYPDITYVRMLYGLVLYRLGNLTEAEDVLTKLLSQKLSDAEAMEVQKYLDAIGKARRNTSYTLTIGMGMHYDDNRNSATRSGNLSLLGITFPSGDKKRDDVGTLLSGTFEARHDPGFQRAHEFYARGTVVADEQAAQNAYSLAMGRVDVGATLSYDIGKIDASLNASTITLERKHYMRSAGLDMRWDANKGETLTPYVTYGATLQNFDGQKGRSAARQRNGLQHVASVGAKANVIQNGLTDVSVSYTKKNALKYYNSHVVMGANLSHTQVFEGGKFLIGRASYEIDKYNKEDFFVAPIKRRDRRITLALTGGAPLGSILTVIPLPESAQNIMLSTTVERSISNSNIYNYQYSNWRGQLMLSKAFSF